MANPLNFKFGPNGHILLDQQDNEIKKRKNKDEPGPRPPKPLREWTKDEFAEFCPYSLWRAHIKASEIRGEDLLGITADRLAGICHLVNNKKLGKLVKLLNDIEKEENLREQEDEKLPEIPIAFPVDPPPPDPPVPPVEPQPPQPQEDNRGPNEEIIINQNEPDERKNQELRPPVRPFRDEDEIEPDRLQIPNGITPREFFTSERFPIPGDPYEDYGNELPHGFNRYLPDLEVRYPQHPPTNGPRYRARMKDSDPRDEPVMEPGENFRPEILRQRFGGNLEALAEYGYHDEKRNLRLMNYYGGSVERVVQYYHQTCMDVRIGDRVIRDIDWIWGDQDSCHVPLDPRRDVNDVAGRDNHFGVVRALRRWHPLSAPETEVVVQWDNNYVGNYRYGHDGAFDVRVISRGRDIRVRPIHVGDAVSRGEDWKNGEEDGGPGEIGEVTELYSAPTTFAPGVRVAVMWDKDEEHWLRKVAELRDNLRRKFEAPDFDKDEYRRQEMMQFPEGRWLEPDLLCRPPVRYRWGIAAKYDLWPVTQLEMNVDEYLQVTDQVRPGRDHEWRVGEPRQWDESTVMAVDQWDPLSHPVRGDRVTVLHNPKVKYRFNFGTEDVKIFDCQFGSRGEDFTQGMGGVPLRVGDRVMRGPDWLEDYYENEDGRGSGTVTAINYCCSITSMLAKVRWPNGTENLYGWGWKNKYELRRVERE